MASGWALLQSEWISPTTALIALSLLGAALAGWLLRGWQQRRPGLVAKRPADPAGLGRAGRILQLAGELTVNLSSDHLPQLVLELGVESLASGADNLAAALLVPEADGMRLAAGHSLPQSDIGQLLPGDQGALQETLASESARTLRLPSDDPGLGSLAGFQACRSGVCLPLADGGTTLGAMLFGHARAGYFERLDPELLQAVRSQATSVLRSATRIRELELERDRITATEEEARKRLARDLHDGPTQTVAAIAMRLNFARRLIERDPSAAGEEIEKLEDIARQTTREIRHMLFTLRPLVLEAKGLEAALQQLAKKLLETHGQEVHITAEPGAADGLDPRSQAVAFFIAEEAVNNARKHAEAQNVWIRLRTVHHQRFILEIQDDGVGFNVGAVDAHYEQRGSLGMVNMRERADLINAILRIESAEGRGTHVILEVPLAARMAPEQLEPDAQLPAG